MWVGENLKMSVRKRTSTKPQDTTHSAFRRSILMTTAGRTSTSRATARRAFFITTIAMGRLQTWRSRPVLLSMKMAASKPAWDRRLVTLMATAASSRGLAIGDLWNDGRVSAVVSNMNAMPSLLVNQVRTPNHWIGIRTIGTKSNRDGIGARITLKAGPRTLVDEVRSGSSYDSNNDMRVHFGLGGTTKIDFVQIRWPSGLVERFESPKVDSIQTIKEASGTPLNQPKAAAVQ